VYLIALLNITILIGFLTINDKHIIDYWQATIYNSIHERNTLLYSILDTISKLIEQSWRIPQNDN
jgi:high-affinity nickel permease